jgi:hypothetical protein
VRLVTATGEDPASSWHFRDNDLNTEPLLEALAVVQAVHQPHLDAGWLTGGGHGGLTVGVFGGVEAADLPLLRRMRHQAGSALAIALDVDAWASPATAGRGAAVQLAQQGWRTVSLGPGERLDTVWQGLGRSGKQATRVGGLPTTPAQESAR